MKNKHLYVVMLNLCIYVFLHLCILAFPTTTHAQSSTLSVSPPVVEIIVAPGKAATQTFKLQAQGQNLELTPSIHLLKPSGDNGQVTISQNQLDLSTIPLKITMSGTSTSPTLTFEAANTDTTQDIYLALVWKPKVDDSWSGHITSTLPGISSLILVTISSSGVIPTNLTINSFDLPTVHDSWTPLTTNPTIYNGSPIMIRPEGSYEIICPTGKVISTTPLYPNLILGDSSRVIRGQIGKGEAGEAMKELGLTWAPSWRNLGPHTIRLTINTQGGTKLTQIEKTVWILPIRLILILTTIIVLGMILLTSRRNNITVK